MLAYREKDNLLLGELVPKKDSVSDFKDFVDEITARKIGRLSKGDNPYFSIPEIEYYRGDSSTEEFDMIYKDIAKDNYGFDFKKALMYIKNFPDDKRFYKIGNIYTFQVRYPKIVELFIKANSSFDSDVFKKYYFDMLSLAKDDKEFFSKVDKILEFSDAKESFFLNYPELAFFYYKVAPMVDFEVLNDCSLIELKEARRLLNSDFFKNLPFNEVVALKEKIDLFLSQEKQDSNNAKILRLSNVNVHRKK